MRYNVGFIQCVIGGRNLHLLNAQVVILCVVFPSLIYRYNEYLDNGLRCEWYVCNYGYYIFYLLASALKAKRCNAVPCDLNLLEHCESLLH